MGNAGVFAFAAPLSEENSNFRNSQLIIPVFYNLGIQSLPLSKLYYTIGQPNSIAIQTTIGQDGILTLNSEETSVIPLQKTYSKSVLIETDNFPNTAGILSVKNKTNVLQNLSFNFDRKESHLRFYNLDEFPDFKVDSSVSSTLDTIKSSTNINALWKWFVTFALVFLIIEILLLKYLK